MQNINYNLSRTDSGANGIGKLEQNGKGEQMGCRSSQEAGSRLLGLVEGLVTSKDHAAPHSASWWDEGENQKKG